MQAAWLRRTFQEALGVDDGSTVTGMLPEEVGDWDTDGSGDTQQQVQGRVRVAGFDVLVVGSVDRYGQKDLFLSEVVVLAGGADASADAASLVQEPLVVAGRVF
jgi:hypothetical protein